MNLGQAIAANAGTIVTVGGSIAVAFIGAMGLVWAKGRAPAREPVPIQDIWEENRLVARENHELRERMRDLEARFDAQVARLKADLRNYREGKDIEVKITRQAVVILWNYAERIKLEWGSDKMPALTAQERAILHQVLEDVDTPPDGIPAVRA